MFPRPLTLQTLFRAACALVFLGGLANPTRLRAQSGSVDANFNPGTGPNDFLQGILLQPDGKSIIAGGFTTVSGVTRNRIARLNADGTLDPSFDPGAGPDSSIEIPALQPDGKIVITGEFTSVDGVSRNYLARLNADGSLDTGFNPGTGTDLRVIQAIVQPDGKIVIGGDFNSVNGATHNRVARLNADGSLDPTFKSGTRTTNNVARGIAVQPDGRVLLGGAFTTFDGATHTRLVRLLTDGTAEGSTFAPSFNSTVRAILVQPDNKILVGGDFVTVNSATRGGIARLNTDGTLDTGFNPGSGASGYSRPSVYGMTLQPDGKIVIAGEFTTFEGVTRNCVARLNADGTVDPSFDTSSGANYVAYCAAVQPDGKVFVGGGFTTFGGVTHGYLVRLNGDPRGVFQFDAASYNAAESLGGVTLAVTRMGGSAGVVSVNYATANGSAQAGVDYAATGGTLYWADGDATPKIITVPIINDAIAKSGESFAVVLGGPGGGAGLGAPVQSVVNILDDDVPTNPGVPAPVITSSATAAAQVGASFSFAITATNSPTNFAAVGLPPGLGVDPKTGLIAGTPTTAGTFTVGVGATNAGGTGTGSLVLTVTVPPANITAVNILSPPTNIAIVAGETIDLQVAVEAVNGTLGTVEFDVTDAGGTRTYLGNSTAPRDHKTWNPTALGDFTLSATATDTTGKTARSEIPIHVVAGTNPPVSQLLSGLDGKTFAAGSTLSLVALATDAGGQPLANVQFYLDGVLIPGVTTAAVLHRQDAAASPYAKTNARLGNLIGDALLTMTGTDGRGVTSVSKAANVHIKAATAMFNCAITSPDGSGTFAPGQSVTATATAVETGGSVGQVEYFLNDRSVGVSTSADFPLAFALPGTAGQYALTAIATDTAGVSAASAPVILSAVEALLPPPTVTIAVAGNTSVKEGSNAKLVLRREGGDTSRAVTVRYKLAGAARAGADYKPLIGSVVIPAGAPSAKLKLKTLDNATADGTRVVKIKLLPATDGSYTLGNPATAKLKITDND